MGILGAWRGLLRRAKLLRILGCIIGLHPGGTFSVHETEWSCYPLSGQGFP